MSTGQSRRTLGGSIAHWMNRLVRRFGFVLLPISEIARMESDAADSYRCVRADKTGSYHNGIADYASKKALQLRERYLPGQPATARAQLVSWVYDHVKPIDPPNDRAMARGEAPLPSATGSPSNG